MYLIELIIKKFFLKKQQNSKFVETQNAELQEEICEKHEYFPVDSSKKCLSCKNCGHIIIE